MRHTVEGQAGSGYLNLKAVTLSADGPPLIAPLMASLTADLRYQAVGGPALGAAPIMSAILCETASRGLLLDGFLVRRGTELHGLGQQIEGPSLMGRSVLIVDVVCASGNTVLSTVAAVQAAGASVACVAVIVDRGARQPLEGRRHHHLSVPADGSRY
jgi:orotate phosphoribosyltransferase